MTRLVLAVSIAGLLVAAGCSTRSDLTAISSKNVKLDPLRLDPARSKGRASGEDCTSIIIIFPTGGRPTIDEALDRALESKSANLLTDAVVTWSYFYIPAALAAAASSGCTNRVGDLTLLSTKNIDLSNVRIDVKAGKRVTGDDCAVWPLGLPFRIPTLEGAVDDALQRGGGNIMIDQVTYQSSYTWIIATYFCIRTEGTVLDKTAKPPT